MELPEEYREYGVTEGWTYVGNLYVNKSWEITIYDEGRLLPVKPDKKTVYVYVKKTPEECTVWLPVGYRFKAGQGSTYTPRRKVTCIKSEADRV